MVNPLTRSNRGRCRGACCSILIGIIGVVILVTNEGFYLRQQKAVHEGMKGLVEVYPNSIDTAHEGKLVHLMGEAETTSSLKDSLFGVSLNETLKLRRLVEMYQWKELDEWDDEGDRKYEKQWESKVINSDEFEKTWAHTNPNSLPYPSLEYVGEPIEAGRYILSEQAVDKIDWYEPVDDILDTSTIPMDDIRTAATSIGSGYFIGENPRVPEIGDLRITFQVVHQTAVSIMARQTGNSLTVYTGHAHGSILLVEQGMHDANEMFQHFEDDLIITTWIMRGLGFLCIYLCLRLMTLPFEVLSENIPIFGRLVGAGSRIVAFGVAVCVWFFVVALAWLWYRPVISLTVLAILAGLSFYAQRKNKDLRVNIGTVLDGVAPVREYEVVPTTTASPVHDVL